MDPHDFIEIASELVTGIKEAEWRSAVSRAYYAAFHLARRLLLQCGFVVPQADQAHGYIWLRLSNCGHPDVVIAGSDLRDLRTARNRADYDLDHPFAEQPAYGHVQVGLNIIQLLDQVLATPSTQQQITDKIKDYEKNVLKQSTWKP
jgi:uncharacterized protein (UPF0332 family)